MKAVLARVCSAARGSAVAGTHGLTHVVTAVQNHPLSNPGLVVLLLMACGPVAAQSDWPEFRGPGGHGHSVSDAPLSWNEVENIVWKTPIPGRGWSSPVVDGNQIWLTTAIEKKADPDEAERRNRDSPAAHLPLNTLESASLRAVCVDRDVGKIIHDIELFHVKRPEPVHQLNSYASPTAPIERGRLYCNFGTWGTACVDTSTAEVLWRADYPLQHYVGPGSSPILYRDRLILTCDGADQQYLVAINKTTGKEIWRTDRPPLTSPNPDLRKSYCTPLVVQAAGQSQIVAPGAQWVVAYDPETGEEIWRVEHGFGFSLAPRPVHYKGLVYVCTGYGGSELLAIRPDGRGDVTDSHVVWRSSTQVPNMPSPLIYDGLLFTISDQGVAVCRDAASGDEIWKKRIGGNYSASPLLSAGRVYFFNREGRTTVITAEGSFRLLAENELDGSIMASPAVLDDGMFLRTEKALYRIARSGR